MNGDNYICYNCLNGFHEQHSAEPCDCDHPKHKTAINPNQKPDETAINLRCAICGLDPRECTCPECPRCGEIGDPRCYREHGLRLLTDDMRIWLAIPERAQMRFKDANADLIKVFHLTPLQAGRVWAEHVQEAYHGRKLKESPHDL